MLGRKYPLAALLGATLMLFGGTVQAFYRLQDRLLGELLEMLLDRISEVMEAGHQSVTWTGKNDRGQTVASGTYFARAIGIDTRMSAAFVARRSAMCSIACCAERDPQTTPSSSDALPSTRSTK